MSLCYDILNMMDKMDKEVPVLGPLVIPEKLVSVYSHEEIDYAARFYGFDGYVVSRPLIVGN